MWKIYRNKSYSCQMSAWLNLFKNIKHSRVNHYLQLLSGSGYFGMNADNLPFYFKWHEHGIIGTLENEHFRAVFSQILPS